MRADLVSSSSEGLHDDGSVRVLASDREDGLSDVDSGNGSVGLTPRTSHTLRQPIGSGARQGLVASDDVERVHSDSEVERLLSGRLDDVLVGTDSGGLEGLGRDLLVLVRDEVRAEGEVVDRRLLSAEIEDSDLEQREQREREGGGLGVSTTRNLACPPRALPVRARKESHPLLGRADAPWDPELLGCT